MNIAAIDSMSNDELLEATRALARRGCALEAELLVHLAEIDERKLYLDRAFSSMFAFCTGELGFSEGAAYNRIFVARAARKLPALIEAVRSGSVHVTALRLLAPHLTEANHADLIARAAGRTREQVAELVASLAPQPAPATQIRTLPAPTTPAVPLVPQPAHAPVLAAAWPVLAAPPPPPVTPIAQDTYKLQLTISREFREELREAQALLRHRIPGGDLAVILRTALGQLVASVKKERFAVGRKPRSQPESIPDAVSRHVPHALKRAVYERDGGRCTFTSDGGRRCDEAGALELDHLDGFARTHCHDLDGLRLLCRAHNQHAADQLYGRAFMQAKRSATCSETSCDTLPSHRGTTGAGTSE